MIFDSARVLTVRELQPGNVLHSGRIGNECAAFRVLAVVGQVATIKLGESAVSLKGDSRILLTGRDLRASECYLAESCPLCGKHGASFSPRATPAPLEIVPAELTASNVGSRMRFKQARRFGVGEKYGGAYIRTAHMSASQRMAKKPEDSIR